ncbi:hypothetical protein HanXRQr2_Chr13g0603851 [Helianthus annuus]|uniref:Uncharacterized protein n=1 Tax=Helianthus annuus TaxID=4232 RepID=A0A9K3HDN8_HELAN|nr:hypothetical protein HanXRQr2_Chr13g0603851 [Helianthus annuus]KAJ0850527.1 hypothetical protein HanPSC8_Chr13g0581881 [Helianthus annuus]
MKGSENVEFECLDGELGSGVVMGGAESGSGDGAYNVFDGSPERTGWTFKENIKFLTKRKFSSQEKPINDQT